MTKSNKFNFWSTFAGAYVALAFVLLGISAISGTLAGILYLIMK